MLEVVGRLAKTYGAFGAKQVQNEVANQLGSTDKVLMKELLGYWAELALHGLVVNGDAKGVWQQEQFILTENGANTIEHASRYPINAEGYLAYLDQQVSLSKAVRSYVEEALNTYRNCCYKATAVLIGAASEGMVLELRDVFLDKLKAAGKKVPKGLDAWQIKTVMDAILDCDLLPDLLVEAKKSGDEGLRQLHEQAEARLSPCAAEFRKTRNAAGHPAILDPVEPADVHCNMLLFPSTARTLSQLTEWVKAHY
jgi:hypothetical protein